MQTIIKDTWIRIASPFILIALSIASQKTLQAPYTIEKLGITFRLILFIVINFEIGRWMTILARQKFPRLQQTRKRVAVSLLLCVAVTFLIISISTLVNRIFIEKPIGFFYESLLNFFQSLWIGALIVAPYEVLHTYVLLIRSEQEKEALIKENMQTKLHSLQAQINPHFLFNSLNTLSALTISSPVKAEEFVLELSAVYRYLLHSATDQLTTLEGEVRFIQSYLHLLQTRYGTALQCTVAIDPMYYQYCIPPLTLQLLVENAVKHNTLSEKTPLTIHIGVDAGARLVVTNTINTKETEPHSLGFGLSNIASRYRLLGAPEVIISKTETEFRVELPLIKNQVYAGADR